MMLTPDVSGEKTRTFTTEPSSMKRLCREFKQLKSPSKAEAASIRYTLSDGDLPVSKDSPCQIYTPSIRSSRADAKLVNAADVQKLVATLPLYKVNSVEKKDGTITLALTPSRCSSNEDQQQRTCVLRGFWIQTPVASGDEIIVIGEFDARGCCLVDDESNFLILHPDTLISPTLLGGTTYCARKALLQEMIRSDTSMEMFIGTLVHDLMQRIAASIAKVAKSNGQPVETSFDILKGLLHDPRYRQDMYSLNVTEVKILDIASSFIPNIEKWAWEEFRKPGVHIVDIEEWIWSPKFGFKGRVDMTLRTREGITPLEIKTGKASFAISHSGQVLLYTLLLSEKYKTDINHGVLYYAKTGESKSFPARHLELQGLIQMRNEISNYLKRCHFIGEKAVMNLPAPINDQRICSQCPLSTVCSLFYKTVEEPRKIRILAKEHYMHTLAGSKMQHLQQVHLDYFEKWMIMLYMEVHHAQKNVSVLDLWFRQGAVDNGKPEQGVGGLRLTETKVTPNQQLCYCMTATTASNVALSVGDLILLREHNSEGLVVDLCTIITIVKEPVLFMELQADRFFQSPRLNNQIFRVDKYIYSASSMAGSNDSLMKLMEVGEKSARLRRLFLQKYKPDMSALVDKTRLQTAKCFIKPLPKEQQEAIVKCLMSLDYYFIDTQNCADSVKFVADLLKILLKCGQSVLFISANNHTLDNILLTLRQDDQALSLIRLGAVSRVHADLKDICLESLVTKVSFDEFANIVRTANLLASTNGTHRQSGLMHREFDVCVINEASVMLQPSVFGFLLLAKRFILLGDSFKRPNCRCPAAVEMGMDESLMMAMKEVAVQSRSWSTI